MPDSFKEPDDQTPAGIEGIGELEPSADDLDPWVSDEGPSDPWVNEHESRDPWEETDSLLLEIEPNVLWPGDAEADELWPEDDSEISDETLGGLRKLQEPPMQKSKTAGYHGNSPVRFFVSSTYGYRGPDWPAYRGNLPSTHPYSFLAQPAVQPSEQPQDPKTPNAGDLPVYWPPETSVERSKGAPQQVALFPVEAKRQARVVLAGSPFPDMGLAEFRSAIFSTIELPKVTFVDRIGGVIEAPNIQEGYSDYLARLHQAELAAQGAFERKPPAGMPTIALILFQQKHFVVFADSLGYLGGFPNIRPFAAVYPWRDPLWKNLREHYRQKNGPEATLPKDGSLRPFFAMDPLAGPLLDQMDYLEGVRGELRDYMHQQVIEFCLRYPKVLIREELPERWEEKEQKMQSMGRDSGIFEFLTKLRNAHPGVVVMPHARTNRCPCGKYGFTGDPSSFCTRCGSYAWPEFLDVIGLLRRSTL